MACCGSIPTDPEGVLAKVDEIKDQAMGVMDDLGDKFQKLSEELSQGISMEPVTNAMNGMVGNFRELAEDPSKVLGAAGVCACCLPLATLKATIGELAETISSVGSGFGAMEKIMKYVNMMIEGLSGIGEVLSATMSALGDLPDLISTLKEALTGGGDKAAASQSIDTFLESAGLKKAADALSAVLSPIESISKSKELDDIIEMVSKLGAFIADAPSKLKSMIPPIPCLPIPAPITMLISGVEGFSGMFDTAAIEKVLNMAKGQKGARRAARDDARAARRALTAPPRPTSRPRTAGVSASSATSPLTGLESALSGAKMFLKV